MKVLVQRVTEASVTIDGRVHSEIGQGMVILLGVRTGDIAQAANFLADKCSALRIFEDAEGKMNVSVKETGGSALVVSQFTLYGDAQRGNRPSFTDAARPEEAEPLYERFAAQMRSALGNERVKTGVFGAMMKVHLVNDGPVTIMIESKPSR